MASAALAELESLVAAGGVRGALARGAVAGLGALSVSELLNFFTGHKDPTTRAATRGAQYALVDLHNNTVITFVSKKRAYRLLIRSRRRAPRHTRTVFVQTAPQSIPSSIPALEVR